MLAENSTSDWISSLTLDDLMGDAQSITARLRREAPLAWVPVLQSWVASTWDLCQAIASDSNSFAGGETPATSRTIGRSVLSADGDVLADLRHATRAPVSARMVRQQVEAGMRPTAKQYIDRLRGKGAAELMAEYFEPISVRCVADSYGFLDVNTETLRRWFHALVAGVTNISLDADGSFTYPEGFDEADRAREEITEYIRGTAEIPDSAISQLLAETSLGGEVRSIEYLLPSILVVLVGGLQEPGHACANTFVGLHQDMDQLRRVISDPGLIPRAVAEALRWMSPIYGGPMRTVRHNLTYAGATLHTGETVQLAYGSANHDDAEFDHPAVFDLDRRTHGHLAFGAGSHSCLGSAVAPQIARVALEELFAAFPTMAIDTTRPPVARGWAFLGPSEVHVWWGAESGMGHDSSEPAQTDESAYPKQT